MNSFHRHRLRLFQAAIVVLASLSLTACTTVNLADFDETSPYGILIIGNAFDTDNVAASGGYQVDFRTFDREQGRMRRQSHEKRDGFRLSRGVEDKEAAVGAAIFGLQAYLEDFSETKYYLFKLEPAEYVLFKAGQPTGGIYVTSCFKPPVLGFHVKAGEMIYVGNMILETGVEIGSFAIKEIARDDEAARAAVVEKGGDPSKMQWQAFHKVDFQHRECVPTQIGSGFRTERLSNARRG